MNGLGIEDRQILLAHSSRQWTKEYTHPIFNLALEFVIRMPNPPIPGTQKIIIDKTNFKRVHLLLVRLFSKYSVKIEC